MDECEVYDRLEGQVYVFEIEERMGRKIWSAAAWRRFVTGSIRIQTPVNKAAPGRRTPKSARKEFPNFCQLTFVKVHL
jgi:hypothetical protein